MKKTTFFMILLIFTPFFLSAQERPENRYFNPIQNIEEIPIPGDGPLASPVPSPSEKFLAFTKENFKGIYLFSFETGRTVELSNMEGSGFGFDWSEADLIAFRASSGNGARRHIICVAHTDGVIEVATPLLESLSLPLWVKDNVYFAIWDKTPELKTAGPDEKTPFDEIVFCHPSGRLASFDNKSRPIKSLENYSQKVFFLPRVSEDGQKFLFHCLDGHIYLGKPGEKSLDDVGEGSGARFAKNGGFIVFERTTDDGHNIVSSDLFLYEIATRTTYRLTDTKDKIERAPSIAEDGCTIFFVENGKIMKGVIK